jgi:hypothetical protein
MIFNTPINLCKMSSTLSMHNLGLKLTPSGGSRSTSSADGISFFEKWPGGSKCLSNRQMISVGETGGVDAV